MTRTALLFTGGTILMQRGEEGALLPDERARDLVDELPVLGRLGPLSPRAVLHLDSGDMQPEHWVTIARAVHEELSHPDVSGVVVLHGTDTMAYTASAVALLLGPVDKPVVFTGAQRPLAEARTDARANLVDACLVARMPVPEVGVAFASRFLRGARATKRDAWALDAFDSPNLPALVDLGLSEHVAPHVRAPAKLGPLDARLDPRVLAIRVFPGLDPSSLLRALAAGLRGLVLEGYGTGNLPHLSGSLIPVLDDARARGVPVVVVSQCPRGAVELGRYEGGLLAERSGAISGRDMTVEAAIAKTMIALGRYASYDAQRAFIARDLVGEISPPQGA
ncbi:MAG: asparaginase [Polyangiaceae bacterium]|nr:asparaginase [Polyangiaceae bacterium]